GTAAHPPERRLRRMQQRAGGSLPPGRNRGGARRRAHRRLRHDGILCCGFPEHDPEEAMNARWSAAVLGMAVALGAARDAGAFCGFYVSGADAKLTNDATQVVLMRDGTRTVLSMQNNYQGPPQDFAMVIPVPVVLQKENVKTLERAVFDRVDQLTAPRLVEYWEQDPCPRRMEGHRGGGPKGMVYPMAPSAGAAYRKEPAVKIEAQFSVGEYDIVVLSASDA